MSVRLEDVLQVNFVLVGIRLLNTPDERAAFNRIIDTEVSEAPGVGELTFNAPEGTPIDLAPKTLTLNRDRISLTLLPDRSTISRDYPLKKDDLERLGDVAKYAIDRSNLEAQQLRAFGFNIDVVYELTTEETAIQFIGNRMFAPNLFQEAGYGFVGGQCRLYLIRNGQPWNITIEPRRGDLSTNKVFVSLNLHRAESKIPSRYEIRKSLQEVWAQTLSIMEGFSRDQ